MPFDGKTFAPAPAETKPDVFSLDGLIAWLEKQPPETEYNFKDTRDCLLCRYFRAMGLGDVRVGGTSVHIDGRHVEFPPAMTNAAVRRPARGSWDYKTALATARSFRT